MAEPTVSRLERWLPIHLPGYEVSDLGRVRSLARVVYQCTGKAQPQPARDHRTRKGASGYLVVSIRYAGKRKKYKVHLLVARAFLGDAPTGEECRHKDGNRLNPKLTNLHYGSRKQNIADAIEHGTFGRLKKNRKLESQRGINGRFKSGPAVKISATQ